MERFTPLLLDVWREACRHIEIADAVNRIAPLLTRRLPVETVIVRRFDLRRSCLETVAVGEREPGGPRHPIRSECSPAELETLLAWCRRKSTARGSAARIEKRLPKLLPQDLEGDIIVGALAGPTDLGGVLIVVAAPRKQFDSDHESAIASLLEPFTVALENDQRVHELTTLREAAEADNQSLRARLGRPDDGEIVGARSGMRAALERVELVAPSDVPVLILGETGSGKEVVARAIHHGSPRAAGPFLRVNCGAIPSELIDSELFGHERGSFTGAAGQRKGWFERADNGTLFLDECGELTPAAQVRLLRILQDGSFERVGGDRQITVNVRIVAATHRDLRSMVAHRTFREDLWYRLAVFAIELPPLRDRTEDIPEMAAHFAMRAAARFGLAALVPTPGDINLLVDYAWPGNVRELRAVIERAAILGNGKRLEVAKALGVVSPLEAAIPRPAMAPSPLPQLPALAPNLGAAPGVETLDQAMVAHIEAALKATSGRIEGKFGAARLLKINPHTLRARMRKLGIDWKRFRDAS